MFKTVLIIVATLTLAIIALWATVGLSCLGLICSKSTAVHAAEAKTSVFRVEGMTCGGCAAGLKMTLRKMEGVQKAEASYEERKAVVTYDPAKVKPEQIKSAIEKLGYKAALEKSEGGKK